MPNIFKTFAEVINFAVMREEEAYKFYIGLSGKTKDLFMQELFADFAEEELKHKKILKNLDAHGLERIYGNFTQNMNKLHVAQALEDLIPSPDMDFKELLIIAMKREEKSQHLYSFLAEISDDNDVSVLFVGLAKEEEKHKFRIEKTYKQLYKDMP